MRRFFHIVLSTCILLSPGIYGQISPTNPYCTVGYTSGQCNQPNASNTPGNSVNDFINDFNTCGANNNIVNNGSGCNGQTNNYIYYANTYTLIVAPGQLITCNLRSGITYGQGFAIFVDWNQNNQFDLPGEQVATTSAVPTANTWTVLSFSVPSTQGVGFYRMRVRCSFATVTPPPCGNQTYGETEDYDLVVVANNTSGVLTATASSNSPLCSGQSINLGVNTSNTSTVISTPTYTWTGPGSYTSSLQNPTITNASSGQSGVYTVTIPNGGCPVTSTVNVYIAPNSSFSVSPASYTICQGGHFTPIAIIGNPSLFSYSWGPANSGIFNPGLQSTFIQPPLLPSTVSVSTIVYSITVTPTVPPTVTLSCPTMHTLTLTINNPLTPTITSPPPLCDIFTAIQLTAAPGGGTWSANPAVSSAGQFSPSLATIGTNSVVYTVNAGTCQVSNSGTISVSKFHSSAFTNTNTLANVCVRDPLINLMHIVQDTITGYWTGQNVLANIFMPAGLASGSYSLVYHTSSTPVASVCPASSVLTVPVFNPPIPIIAAITPLCDNAGTVALSAFPANGIWSGNSGVSATGIRTPSLNLPGVNSVTYTAGQGTCVASSSSTFHLSHFNTAALSGSLSTLCANNNPVYLMSIVQNTNGSWSGINVDTSNFFHPLGLSTYTYALVYKTRSTPMFTLCPDTRTLTVSVLNPITPSIIPVGPYCSKASPVQLTVTPSVGHWVNSAFLTSGGIFTPSLCAVGSNIVQYIIGTNTCNASQAKTIQVEAFVSAAILGQLPDQCNTNVPVSLLPLTLNNSGYWTGPGISGNTFSPAITGSGSFSLSYHTSSSPSGLCPDQSAIAVRVFSIAPPSITKAGPFCDVSAPVQLLVSPVGGIFAGGSNNAVNPGGIFNPALAAVGANLISYSVMVGPCMGNAQTTISVEKFISADFGKNMELAYCKNQPPFNLNGLVQNPGGTWSGPGVVGNTFDPSQANIGDNNFITYYTHSSPSVLLCPDSSSVRIKVKGLPVVTLVSSTNGGCAPLEVTLNTPNTNNGIGSWHLSDGTVQDGLSISHIFTNPGTYSVVFNYADEEARSCSTQVVLARPISVYESPRADFSVYPGEISISNPEASITNLTTVLNDNRYLWSVPGASLTSISDLHPKVDFPHPGNYKITLTATSVFGCKDEVSKMVEVKNDFNIYIPDSFTPNYDGLNDIFIPVFTSYGLDTKTFEMEIFDRWGHELYDTKDATKGWNGAAKNSGDILKEGIYIFTIKYKDLDGRIYNKTGHLTLLKN